MASSRCAAESREGPRSLVTGNKGRPKLATSAVSVLFHSLDPRRGSETTRVTTGSTFVKDHHGYSREHER